MRKKKESSKLKVLGYLTNEGENRSRPYNSVRETNVSVVLRERVVTEIPEFTTTAGTGATTTEYKFNPATGEFETTIVSVGPTAGPDASESVTTIGMELYDSDFREEVTIGSDDEDEE